MLRTLAALALLAAVVAAATVERPGRYTQAEERDGAHHSSQQSSYSAPAAPAAPATSYSAGGGSGSGSSDQGNLYYYYYPVDEYGSTDVDAGFDIFTSIILPLVILGGLLLALSSLTFTFTGRAMRESAEPGVVDQLHSEIERIFYIYLNSFESDSCVQRAVCQSGAYAKEFKNKEFYLSMAEPFVPATMRGNMAIFKMAAKDGFDTGKCKKYRCKAPKIFD